jgi:dihydrolipoamide dehydrogenase
MLAEALRANGIDVRTGERIDSVESGDGGSGRTVRTTTQARLPFDRLLVALGKRPRVAGLGLDRLGLDPDAEAVDVDERLRARGPDGAALPDVFAIGDVNAVSPYTHSANQQARLVVAHLLGHGRDADHTGIPRAVYTDPALLAAGESEPTARERGVDVEVVRFDATQTARAFVERSVHPDDDRPAVVELVADAGSGRLIGAAALGPDADSWAGELALAVRLRLPVDVLADHVQAFPTWTEAIGTAARELAARLAARGEPTSPEPTSPEPTSPEPTSPEPTSPEPTSPKPDRSAGRGGY